MFMLRDYQKGDIYKVLLHKNEQYQTLYAREDLLMENIAFTGFTDDYIVGCAGLFEMWEGVFEAWIALDERYKREHISLLKMLKNTMDNLTGNIIRVQTHMNVNTENYRKLMEFLGFELEARLVKYFPNQVDCEVFRRLY